MQMLLETVHSVQKSIGISFADVVQLSVANYYLWNLWYKFHCLFSVFYSISENWKPWKWPMFTVSDCKDHSYLYIGSSSLHQELKSFLMCSPLFQRHAKTPCFIWEQRKAKIIKLWHVADMLGQPENLWEINFSLVPAIAALPKYSLVCSDLYASKEWFGVFFSCFSGNSSLNGDVSSKYKQKQWDEQNTL